MRNCSRCGVPRMLIKEHGWDPNGTIALVNDPTHRMVIIDVEALSNIFDSIAGVIGIPVDNMIVESKRKSGAHFMDAVLSGLKGVLARNLASAKVYQQLCKQVSMLGYGQAEVVDYKRHRYLEGVVHQVYMGPAMAGDIYGAFESVERVPCEVEYEIDGEGNLYLAINRTEENPAHLRDRFGYVPPPVLKGRNIFELCPECKAPLELGTRYSFDMESGIITEAKTGHRVILMGVMTINNLFDELEKELGGEIPGMIMSIEKERVKKVILDKGGQRDTSEAGYTRYMKALQLRGLGNGSSVSIDGGSVKVHVDNPYYEPLIAGFLAGFYEATTGNTAQVRWTPSADGFTEVSMESG